ncbi:hypothetical protein ANTPLA_LOCUS1966 [Anthophora plagiata]
MRKDRSAVCIKEKRKWRIIIKIKVTSGSFRCRICNYEKETGSTLVQEPETGFVRKATKISTLIFLSRIFLQAFTLAFLAEWRDRSQLTTIIYLQQEK